MRMAPSSRRSDATASSCGFVRRSGVEVDADAAISHDPMPEPSSHFFPVDEPAIFGGSGFEGLREICGNRWCSVVLRGGANCNGRPR
jgi:hypothetical protein